MNDRFSIPGAIVLAGAIIAGAIVLTRAPGRPSAPGAAGGPAASPTVAAAEALALKIAFRPVDAARDHIRGPENAKVTLIEYSDTECPFCKRFHPTLQQAIREYPNDVRWVYRHFPLTALHAKALKESEATECAGEQGKFWEYVDLLFERTPSNDQLDPAQLPVIAKDAGLDAAKFEECLSSGRMAPRVQEDLDDAQKAGGQGTPYTVIVGPQGETIPFSGAQPYANLKQVIDGLLKEG